MSTDKWRISYVTTSDNRSRSNGGDGSGALARVMSYAASNGELRSVKW